MHGVGKQLDKMKPVDAKSLRRYRQVMSAGFRSAIGPPNTSDDDLVLTRQGMRQADACTIHSLFIGWKNTGDRVPATEFRPLGSTRGAVLVVHPGGVSELTRGSGRDPGPLIRQLLGKGQSVLVADVFLTGTADGEMDTGEHAYHSTYNRTVTANRVQDIVTAVTWLRRSSGCPSVSLVGIGAAGSWCLLACGLCPQVVRAVIDVDHFDTDSDREYEEKLYIPVLRRLGGLTAAAALATPAELYLHNTGTAFQPDDMEAAYRAADAIHQLRVQNAPADMRQVIAWIVEGSQE